MTPARVSRNPEDPYAAVVTWRSSDAGEVSGRLAPAAVSAEILDRTGRRIVARVEDGTFVASVSITPADELIVCCRDADGNPVRRPRPTLHAIEPVTDTAVLCAACGALDWETGGPMERTTVRCRACGHSETGHFAAIDEENEESDWTDADEAEWQADQWPEQAAALGNVTFPIYAALDWPAELAAWGWAGETVTKVAVWHRRALRVETSRTSPGAELGLSSVAQFGLAEWLRETTDLPDDPSRLSTAALLLSINAGTRARNVAALTADVTETHITIDGHVMPALLVGVDTRWSAALESSGLIVGVCGHGVPPQSVSLAALTDPIKDLLGPRPERQ